MSSAQKFAQCIKMIYPSEMTDGNTFFLKMAITVALLSILASFWFTREDSQAEKLIAAFTFPMVVGFLSLWLWLVAYGVRFLFS